MLQLTKLREFILFLTTVLANVQLVTAVPTTNTLKDVNIYNRETCEANSTSVSSFRASCMIDEDGLLQLLDLILEAQSVVFPPSHPKRVARQECEINDLSKYKRRIQRVQNECQDLIEHMGILVRNITIEIELLIEFIIGDPGHYEAIIEQYKQMIVQLQKQICEMQIEHNQTVEELMQMLVSQQMCFMNLVLEKERQILSLKLVFDQERVDSMSLKLRLGMITEVLMDFIMMNNDSVLEPLINTAYDSHTYPYLGYIGQFIMALPIDINRMFGYNTTLLALTSNQHLLTPNVITFKKVLVSESNENLIGFEELLQVVNTYSTALLRKWATDILSGDSNQIKPIIDFGSPATVTFAGWSFNDVLPQLVSITFGNDRGTLSSLIGFTLGLRWNIQKYTVLSEMLTLFNDRGDKLQIALRIADAMKSLDGPDENVAEIKEKFALLLSSLPSNIRNVVEHNMCHLRNRFNGYRYIQSESIPIGTDWINRPVSTVPTPTGNRGDWKIEPFLVNGEFDFRIRNFATNEYLGSHLSWKEGTGSQGICSTSKAQPFYDSRHYSWKIEYEGNSDIEIILFHVGRQSYLYGTGPWINIIGNRVDDMYWNLECQ